MLATAGCSATSGDGTISGTIVEAGGGAPGAPRVLTQGTVTISGDHASKTLDVDETGHFSAQVPSGDYEVTGTSPLARGQACRANGGVRVVGGQTTTVEVVCSG
jgi:hypothetical protein